MSAVSYGEALLAFGSSVFGFWPLSLDAHGWELDLRYPVRRHSRLLKPALHIQPTIRASH